VPIIKMNPKGNVSIYRNSIRVSECSHLDLLMNRLALLVKGMEALHKTQLLGIREKNRQSGYISMTDYKMLTKVISRYVEPLRLHHAPKVDKSNESRIMVETLAVLASEVADYEAEFEVLQKEQANNAGTNGNFSIRIREEQPVAAS
jgi:hypothetical protein